MTSINKKGQGDPAFENGDGDLKVRMLLSFFLILLEYYSQILSFLHSTQNMQFCLGANID